GDGDDERFGVLANLRFDLRQIGCLPPRASALLFDARRFAKPLAQVKEPGPAHFPSPDHLDPVDLGRVHGKDPFDTHALRDLANHAFKDLDALTVSFGHLDVYFDGIPRPEIGQVGPFLLLVDALNDIHQGEPPPNPNTTIF